MAKYAQKCGKKNPLQTGKTGQTLKYAQKCGKSVLHGELCAKVRYDASERITYVI